jgi:hypothetical protein
MSLSTHLARDLMRPLEFITTMVGSVMNSPLVSHSQPARIPRIGVLGNETSPGKAYGTGRATWATSIVETLRSSGGGPRQTWTSSRSSLASLV